MNIVLNGEQHDVETGTSLRELIHRLGFSPEATAVQRNNEIVARSAYADTFLTEGDTVELVRFVGGG